MVCYKSNLFESVLIVYKVHIVEKEKTKNKQTW